LRGEQKEQAKARVSAKERAARPGRFEQDRFEHDHFEQDRFEQDSRR
jgi:hypothetical protein